MLEGMHLYDAVGELMGLNRYAYVGGNPVNFTDPSGMIAEVPPSTCANRQGCTPREEQIDGIRLTVSDTTSTGWCGSVPGSTKTRAEIVRDVLSAIHSKVGNLNAFDGLTIEYRPFLNAPSECSGSCENSESDASCKCTAQTLDKDTIAWYAGGFNLGVGDYGRYSNNYTPQVVVHELGHVLQNRRPEVLQTATRYLLAVPTSNFPGFRPQVLSEFWLPENANIKITPVAYVRGSYNHPESDFTNEYLADAFVWWIYWNDITYNIANTTDTTNKDKLEIFLNGGSFVETNSDGSRNIYYS